MFSPHNHEGGINLKDVVIGDDDGLPWLRSELDRDFTAVDEKFGIALGAEDTLLDIATRMLRDEGRQEIFILDVGGGTGHTLRTLVDTVLFHTGVDRSCVKGTVLNNNDFSQESESKKTRQAIARGDIEYLVGDAADLPYDNVPNESFDLVYAYELLIYDRQPATTAERLMRLARPTGHVLFNSTGKQLNSIRRYLEGVDSDWSAAFSVIGCQDARGQMQDRAFFHLAKPN